jgi:hypothetical protein
MPTQSSGPPTTGSPKGEGLDGRLRTVRLNLDVLKLVTTVIGGMELRLLTAHDVRRALVQVASGNSSRTVALAHNALTRSLRHAEANRHVAHNVAALVDTPTGQPGRPSKALTAEQAAAVPSACPRPSSKRCGRIASGKTRRRRLPETCGWSTTWSSPPRSVPSWMRPTSAGLSGPSARPPA